jgi:hypothetical protein
MKPPNIHKILSGMYTNEDVRALGEHALEMEAKLTEFLKANVELAELNGQYLDTLQQVIFLARTGAHHQEIQDTATHAFLKEAPDGN